MKPNPHTVAPRLIKIRQDLNLSIAELGAILGNIPKSTVNSWLRGLSLPPEAIVDKLSHVANVTKNWIYWGVDTLDSEFCLHCNFPIIAGHCLYCLKQREREMIVLFDSIDTKLFPMTEVRKRAVLNIVDAELEEIRTRIEEICNI